MGDFKDENHWRGEWDWLCTKKKVVLPFLLRVTGSAKDVLSCKPKPVCPSYVATFCTERRTRKKSLTNF